MKISIIIPTLNEEKYLPGLLKDIKNQTFKDYEVIVADAGSHDKTRQIAQKYGARVVEGGTPPVGRNRGAAFASGEFLFFLDADVRLPKDFLEKAHRELEERFLDLATCEFRPLSRLLIDKISFNSANILMKLAQFSVPHAPGFAIFVTKRLFEKVGGFNESLKQAEDHDFVKRASKLRPLRVLNSTYVKVSIRRLDKEGRINLAKKYFKVELHRLFKGEVKKEIIEYKFGDYNASERRKLEKSLAALEAQLVRINCHYRYLMQKFKKEELTKNYREKLMNLKNQFNKAKESFKKSLKLIKK